MSFFNRPTHVSEADHIRSTIDENRANPPERPEHKAVYRAELVQVGYNLFTQNDPKFEIKRPEEAIQQFPSIVRKHEWLENYKTRMDKSISDISSRMCHNETLPAHAFGCLPFVVGAPLGGLIAYACNLNFGQCAGAGIVTTFLLDFGLSSYIGHKRNTKLGPEFDRLVKERDETLAEQEPKDIYPQTLNALKAFRRNRPDLLIDDSTRHQAEDIIKCVLDKSAQKPPQPVL